MEKDNEWNDDSIPPANEWTEFLLLLRSVPLQAPTIVSTDV